MKLLGISLDEDLEAMRTAIRVQEITWQQLSDGKGMEGDLSKLFAVRGLPAHVVLDAEGRIVGKLDWLRSSDIGEDTEKLLRELMGDGATEGGEGL